MEFRREFFHEMVIPDHVAMALLNGPLRYEFSQIEKVSRTIIDIDRNHDEGWKILKIKGNYGGIYLARLLLPSLLRKTDIDRQVDGLWAPFRSVTYWEPDPHNVQHLPAYFEPHNQNYFRNWEHKRLKSKNLLTEKIFPKQKLNSNFDLDGPSCSRVFDPSYEVLNMILAKLAPSKTDVKQLLNLRCVNYKWKAVTENFMHRNKIHVKKSLLALRKSKSIQDTFLFQRYYNDDGIDVSAQQFRNFMRMLSITGKFIVDGGSETISNELLGILQTCENFRPTTLIINGNLHGLNNSILLTCLRAIDSLRYLHFQRCEVDDYFFDNEFLCGIPNLHGFLIQLTSQCKLKRPCINFTPRGILRAMNPKLEYMFLPYLTDDSGKFRRLYTARENFENLIQKYFAISSQLQPNEYMATVLSFDQMEHKLKDIVHHIHEDRLNPNPLRNASPYAFQLARPDHLQNYSKHIPVIYHSIDCKGTLVIQTHLNGDFFANNNDAFLHFDTKLNYDVLAAFNMYRYSRIYRPI